MARDHFVPKTYLRHFTTDYLSGVPGGTIAAYSVAFDHSRMVSINKHVGFENDLYAQHPMDKQWQACERIWPAVVAALEVGDFRVEIVDGLLAFTSIQFCRVPGVMDVIAKRRAFADRRIIQTDLDGRPVKGMLIKMVHTHDVLDYIAGILPSIIKSARTEYHWRVLRNTTNEQFLTNDQPCMWDMTTGNVTFPISLRLALVGTYTETPNLTPSIKAGEASHDIVRRVNRATVYNANRLIFSPFITDELLRFYRKNKRPPSLDPMHGGRSFSNRVG